MSAHAAIPGVVLVRHASRADARGSFTKLLHPADLGWASGDALRLREAFVSWSSPGVVRGMHFQAPPSDHGKFVTCLAGRVLDVVLDLRRSSPAFGRTAAFELDGSAPASVWIPRGCAHGFAVLGQEPALMSYLVDHEHDPARDSGVRWDSFGFPWPVDSPLLSDRDRALPTLAGLPALFP